MSVQALNETVDEIFKVLEEVRDMLKKWSDTYHMPFIQRAMYLNVLREKLYALGYDDDFVETVIRTAYSNVFTYRGVSYDRYA